MHVAVFWKGRRNQSETEDAEESFYSKVCKLFGVGFVLRVLSLAFLILLIWLLPVVDWILDYVDWVSQYSLWKSALLFTFGGTIFHTFMPTGYFPTVLCGLTYADHFFLAWLISYTFVNLGSIFNMIWVRTLNLACVRSKFSKKIDAFSFLNRLLILQPYKTILLFRLPYLYVGAVNYVMAFSDVDFKTYIIANAIGYISGSGLFTALGRSGKSILDMLSKSKDHSTADMLVEISILLIISVCTIGGIIWAKQIVDKERKISKCEHDMEELNFDKPELIICGSCLIKKASKDTSIYRCLTCSLNQCDGCYSNSLEIVNVEAPL